jgi:hypothetical protein
MTEMIVSPGRGHENEDAVLDAVIAVVYHNVYL